MAVVTALSDAVADLVEDGATVALEGFTHLIPMAAGHEIIRQRRRNLTLVRLTPDIIYDQLIGMGCVSSLVFSWGGNPGVGSLHRFRDALENGWPNAIEIDEHSHGGLTNRFVAGASGLPFMVMRGYVGNDIMAHTREALPIECPFTGERVTAVSALRPDVGIIHAQCADRDGNVQFWGISGVNKEAVFASRQTIVTVEEIVDRLSPVPHAEVLPSWSISAIARVPSGALPSYASGYGSRDNAFYQAWSEISADRDRFTAWMEKHVLGTDDFAGYLESIDSEPIDSAPLENARGTA